MMLDLGADFPSQGRLVGDVWLSRLLTNHRDSTGGATRQIHCRGGGVLRYRLNRGDLQGIREVWCEGAYRLPFELRPMTVVDLGANIGLTSLWFHRIYGCERIIAVEPDPANAALARENFQLNCAPVELIEAAVGPHDGTTRFVSSALSNIGHVERNGSAGSGANGALNVPMVSMDTVLSKLPAGMMVDLLKMDIEGSEAPLIQEGSRDWLGRVKAIIAELHPGVVDCNALISTVESEGFAYIAPNSVFPNNMSAFIRRTQCGGSCLP